MMYSGHRLREAMIYCMFETTKLSNKRNSKDGL